MVVNYWQSAAAELSSQKLLRTHARCERPGSVVLPD